MCGYGASSDDVVLIKKMVTPNMGRLEPGYSEHGWSEAGYSWTWLLRSYLEPCYTDMVVFNIGDRSNSKHGCLEPGYSENG